MIEELVLKDPAVLAEVAKMQLPEGTILAADPWIYGKSELPQLFDFYILSKTLRCFKSNMVFIRIRWHR